jgi:hypothetical protein
MYHFPTDPKKIKQRIRRYERSLRKDDPVRGLRDGYGKRFLLGPRYLMLGNVQDTLDHYQWYQNKYPNEYGYAFNFLCWAITLHRHGDVEEAERKIINTMLSNIFFIPYLLGHAIPSLDSLEDRYYNELIEIESFPHEILNHITREETEWIKTLYNSLRITAIREKYIEIDNQLENLPRGKKRTKLCDELFKIRDLDFSGIDFSGIDNRDIVPKGNSDCKDRRVLGE